MIITPTCTCVVDEPPTLTSCSNEHHTQATIRLTLKLRTVIPTKLHYTEVHMERQTSEGTFHGNDYAGLFRGKGVAIKRLNDVAASDEVTDFLEEVWRLDKFRCDQIVHLYRACVIPNHTCAW